MRESERLKRRAALRHVRAIRNAIVASVDVNQVTEEWFNLHHPDTTGVMVTTAQGRDWSMVNVRVDTTKLKESLTRLYEDAFKLGIKITEKEIAQLKARGKAMKKPDLKGSINVLDPNWSAGNVPAAEQMRRQAFQRLIGRLDSVTDEISRTTKKRIGTLLATALEQGITPMDVSILIDQLLDDPVRALTIAQTEMSDATVQASKELYLQSGVEQVEYLVADPCDLCSENLAASPIDIGEEWPNGDPPVHPNCMCDIAPYVVET